MGGMQTVEEAAKELSAATDSLVDGIGRLTDADTRGPSLLPGWTRGHVLTHLARNADGGTRLLGWARTGIPVTNTRAWRHERRRSRRGLGARLSCFSPMSAPRRPPSPRRSR